MATPSHVPGYNVTHPDILAFQGVLTQLGVRFVHKQGRHASGHDYRAIWLNTDRAVFIFYPDGGFKEHALGQYDDEGNYLPPKFDLVEPEVPEIIEEPENTPEEEVSDPEDGEDLEERDLFPPRP